MSGEEMIKCEERTDDEQKMRKEMKRKKGEGHKESMHEWREGKHKQRGMNREQKTG